MKKNLKRALTTAVAGVMSVNCLALSSVLQAGAATAKYEFESGKLTGDAEVKTDDGNASGGSYVFLKTGGDEISLTVPSEKTGMYTVKVSYSAPYGDKIQNLYVNGVDQGQCSFASTAEGVWKELDLGTVKLTAGDNTIAIKGSWGWTNFDYLTVEEATLPDITASDTTCSDPAATKEADSLMKYLSSVYGKHIISGQQEIYGGGNDGDSEKEFNYIKDNTGKLPAIRGFDFMNYNPLYGWEDGTTERAIKWAKEQNGIVTASWHINVPIDFDKYTLGDEVDWKKCTYKNYQTSNSTFNTANAVKEGTKEYEYFQECMKDLAEQLQKLQDANVPIILRPLHEAQGNEGNYSDGTSWFWWGDRGAAVYKELWKLLYTTLTEEYGLHNIIWEYNSYNYANSDTWYPGDDYVDIVAYDKYNCDFNRDDGQSSGTPNLSAISPIFNYLYELTSGKKMVAMAENDSIPSEENMVIENAGWLYFCPWYGDHLMSSQYNDAAQLKKMYTSDYCITLDELPKDLYGNANTEPGTTVTTDATTDTTAETTTETTATTDVSVVTTTEDTAETTVSETTEAVETTVESSATETSADTTATTASETTVTTKGAVEAATLYGDINLDGRVDITDAVLLNKAAANAVSLSAQQQANADCDESGEVDSNDAVVLLKFLVSIIHTLPNKGE